MRMAKRKVGQKTDKITALENDSKLFKRQKTRPQILTSDYRAVIRN